MLNMLFPIINTGAGGRDAGHVMPGQKTRANTASI